MSIIGIDLGTTNSLVSCYIDNECVLIKNVYGEYLTPSVVSVLDTGEVLIGKGAKERITTHPNMTAYAFKRYIGSKKVYQLGEYSFTPTELSSLVLKSLKNDAEIFLNKEITEAVISVPAYFNDHQRKATKEAAELAGLRVERLINEPTAAAVAYGLHQKDTEKKFLVFDLGGGTFDVSILELFDDIMEVRAVAGDNFLGGEDFDQYIVNYLLSQWKINQDDLDIKQISVLKKKAEICRFELTRSHKAEVTFNIEDKEYSLTIDNDKFEEISEELLIKLKQPLLKALKDSQIKVHELDEIVLVGGATKMPIIRSFAAKLFGRLPLSHINPDEVVGIGAGLYGAMKERHEDLKETILTDVCPYSLGIDVVVDNIYGNMESGRFAPIIERNTTIPCSKVERFYTIYDYQKSINVVIYQGESRLVSNNLKLGQLRIDVPLAPRGRSSIDVRFTYDMNGILDVEVTSVDTKEKKRQIIINAQNNMSQEEIEMRLKELEKIKIHPREEAKNSYLLAKGERLYEESLGDVRIKIAHELEMFEALLNRQIPSEINKAVERFEEFLNFVENMKE